MLNILTGYIKKKPLASIIIFSVLAYLPFLNKPFHIDDPFFLYAARAIGLSPLHPFDIAGAIDLWKHNYNPIFFYYFTALLRAVFGENEIFMHAGYFIFYVTAGIYFYLICKAINIKGIAPALLFLSSPIALLAGTSIMSDFPLIALFLISFYYFIAYLKNDSPLSMAISSLALLAAVFTKYYAGVFIFLYIIMLIICGKWKVLKYLSVILSLLLAALFIYSHSHQIHPLYIFERLGWAHSPVRKETLSFLTTLGGISIFPLCYLLLMGKNAAKWVAYSTALVISAVFCSMAGFGVFAVISASVYLANAVLVFFMAGERLYISFKSKEYPVISAMLWFFGYALFLMIFPNIMAGRYVLPLLPPLILCLYIHVEETGRAGRSFSVIAVFSTLLLGLALNSADYKLAGIYRDFAIEASGNISAPQTGYMGNYAFEYYMQKKGFERFDIKKHKYLIMTKYGSVHVIYGGDPILKDIRKKFILAREIPKEENYLLRIWDPTAFAGFHLNMFGYIPWGISAKPMETFYVFEKK
ncbi:MAG: glycosyltransferase family 39 protein [Elusimicrobiota bacterium]